MYYHNSLDFSQCWFTPGKPHEVRCHGSLTGSKPDVVRYLIASLRWQHPPAVSRSSLIARFMGPKMGPSGADRTQVGPMLAPWILLSVICLSQCIYLSFTLSCSLNLSSLSTSKSTAKIKTVDIIKTEIQTRESMLWCSKKIFSSSHEAVRMAVRCRKNGFAVGAISHTSFW